MEFEILFLVAGLVFIVMALASTLLSRLPLTTSLLYLGVGIAIGPKGLDLIHLDPIRHAAILERLTEVAVLVSLFTAGLKLRVDWSDRRWTVPIRLASISMMATVALIALAGVAFLDLPLGAAILLGAILAPTDPVLASDVQVNHATDQDRVRFSLTGEAGLNDGSAFPFVMLGLGLLELHDLGEFGWRWLAIDVAWAVTSGLVLGALIGTGFGRLIVFLRRTYKEAVGLDEFLVLGLIALSYGLVLLVHGYGFLAVFAAGLALRRVERLESGEELEKVEEKIKQIPDEEIAVRPETAPAYLAKALLATNEQIDRIGEVIVVVAIGILLAQIELPAHAIWFVPLLMLGIRPLAARIGTFSEVETPLQQRLIGWFGIRGIGSIYYLMYAVEHGLDGSHAQTLINLTVVTVAVSVVIHGVSVTPLMNLYERKSPRPESETASV